MTEQTECGMRNAEWGMRNGGIRNDEWEMRNAECGIGLTLISSFVPFPILHSPIPHSQFRIPHSAFRIPIPHSAFRIPHSAFRLFRHLFCLHRPVFVELAGSSDDPTAIR